MRFLPGKVYGVFYKLRDKERSKESAYVSLNLIFRTPPISVYRLEENGSLLKVLPVGLPPSQGDKQE